nr:hypothetical protein [Tanacetum cinerariifolium]
MEVKTLATSSESLLILSAATSPSLILLLLIRASSPDCVAATSSLSSNTLTLWKSKGLSNPCSSSVLSDGITGGMGVVGIDGSGIDEVVRCDVLASGKGV